MYGSSSRGTGAEGGETTGVMAGVRVVELASWVFVPTAGAVLAQWGPT